MLNLANIEQLDNPIKVQSKDGRVLEFKATADFDFESFTLNALLTDTNNVIFVGKEITDILEYDSQDKAFKRLRVNDKYIVENFDNAFKAEAKIRNKTTQITLITETGLYDILAGATRKPKAKPFRYWLFDEVLPSIRKYGIYILEERLNKLEPKNLVEFLSQMNPEADVKEIDGDIYICANDIKENLGLNSTKAIKYRLREDVHFKKYNKIIYVNNTGLQIVIERSRKPEAISIAKNANLNVIKEVPEASVKQHILTTFKDLYEVQSNVPFEFEGVTNYVDILLPEFKLVLEVDEDNHQGYDKDREARREKHMIEVCGWDVLRVNTHNDAYNHGEAINKLLLFIMSKSKTANKSDKYKYFA